MTHVRLMFFRQLFTYLIDVIRRTQEYFTYTRASSITVGGNRIVLEGNPGCLMTFRRTVEEASLSWT